MQDLEQFIGRGASGSILEDGISLRRFFQQHNRKLPEGIYEEAEPDVRDESQAQVEASAEVIKAMKLVAAQEEQAFLQIGGLSDDDEDETEEY